MTSFTERQARGRERLVNSNRDCVGMEDIVEYFRSARSCEPDIAGLSGWTEERVTGRLEGQREVHLAKARASPTRVLKHVYRKRAGDK